MNIAWAPVNGEQGTLYVLDARLRLYAGLNREGTGYHVIAPARPDDPRVGDGLVLAGELVCTCAGGTYRADCYQTRAAAAFEAGMAADVAAQVPSWMPGRSVAPETELEKAGARG